MHWLRRLLPLLCLAWVSTAHALDRGTLNVLAEGDSDKKIDAIKTLASAADAAAIPVLDALLNGTLALTPDKRVVITGASISDALTGAPVEQTDADRVSINNRVRSALSAALASLRLLAPAVEQRRAAARRLQDNTDPALLPLIERALTQETDADIKSQLLSMQARLNLQNPDAKTRTMAATRLGETPTTANRSLLAARLVKDANGNVVETDAETRVAVQRALARIDARLEWADYLGRLFTGLSMGSILLLAALGLAITFGLMGIINMAHGELLMIGAYATYVVQGLFRQYLAPWFDWYLLAAIPVAFVSATLVGMILERSVIRFLYGRPLETLLATWGISLVLIQSVRLLFGAQNVEVANPSWMSGAVAPMPGLVLPYNRIAIIAFAVAVLFLVWLILNRTRLGLYVRAVTQNRRMADCLGVATPKIDVLTFGIGSGIAGLGGVALSQIGNVGPELGQAYIVDSFMVVVLGGVGQLFGTVLAAMGLGEVNKLLEPYAGAVLAKIFVLVFIIVFIQKRPQGLFAMKGRLQED